MGLWEGSKNNWRKNIKVHHVSSVSLLDHLLLSMGILSPYLSYACADAVFFCRRISVASLHSLTMSYARGLGSYQSWGDRKGESGQALDQNKHEKAH